MALLDVLALDHPRSISMTAAAAVGFAMVFLAFVTFQKLGAKRRAGELPWVGINDGEWFAYARASFRTLTKLESITGEGYRKFSRANKPFVSPNFLSGPEVLLPHDAMRRVLSAPDDVLDAFEPQHDSIQYKYTIDNPHLMDHPVHIPIITKRLTRNLGQVTPELADELSLGFDEVWGTDTENWREVPLHTTIMKIVARTANRIFTGLPLCRNEEFLESCRLYSVAVFASGTLIKNFPKFMRPIVGPLLTRPIRKHLANCLKHAKPIIVERLALVEQKRNDPSKKDIKLPNDYITWQIEESYRLNDPRERTPEVINGRLVIMNMVAIHTTSLTSTSTLFDMCSSPEFEGFIAGLREECSRVLSEENGIWTKAGLGKMIRIDSAIKESMRYTGLGLRGLPRTVKDPAGMDLEGHHIPHGATVAFPIRSIHQDERFYPDPQRFDAFRFSRPREEWYATRAGGDDDTPEKPASLAATAPEATARRPDAAPPKDLEKVLRFKNSSMVTVSDEFLTFGNGRHACPGRFFASNEIKILLAYLVLHYDVEPLPERPKDTMFANILTPSQASVRVRRRRVAA